MNLAILDQVIYEQRWRAYALTLFVCSCFVAWCSDVLDPAWPRIVPSLHFPGSGSCIKTKISSEFKAGVVSELLQAVPAARAGPRLVSAESCRALLPAPPPGRAARRGPAGRPVSLGRPQAPGQPRSPLRPRAGRRRPPATGLRGRRGAAGGPRGPGRSRRLGPACPGPSRLRLPARGFTAAVS